MGDEVDCEVGVRVGCEVVGCGVVGYGVVDGGVSSSYSAKFGAVVVGGRVTNLVELKVLLVPTVGVLHIIPYKYKHRISIIDCCLIH